MGFPHRISPQWGGRWQFSTPIAPRGRRRHPAGRPLPA
jgi:hypothetical protein